jgi:hypothetical protein
VTPIGARAVQDELIVLHYDPMDVLWADAEVVSLSFDYDSLRLKLRESTGAKVVVAGEGVLGVEAVGL